MSYTREMIIKHFTFTRKKLQPSWLATEFTHDQLFGTVNFANNNGSALALVSSASIFKPYSNIVFFYNNS